MWITADVELPMELVEAHSSGNLVLFVGAGASKNMPSNLPLFEDLADEVGAMAHRPYPGRIVAIDRFLGELLDGFDVHKHVRDLINRPGSIPNESHRALVCLAASAGAPRIITTNFDVHLQGAAHEADADLGDIYYAPALPVGREFRGLVHLHGAITRPPSELILTDQDFGRAYLTDAWATRFLREVFDNFVVLFVGFSHDDPIMNYLGLGLPSSTRRFILTDKAQDARWKRLGITPVAYPDDNYHAAAARALDEWAKRASMGSLDHRARIWDIVQGGPPKNPVEIDYLSQMLEEPQGARAFAESASDVSWLQWLETLDVFADNFKTNPLSESRPKSEASIVLGRWFCDKYVADTAQQAAALSLIQRTGQQFSPPLIAGLGWAVRQLAEKDGTAARRWTAILAASISVHSYPQWFDSYLNGYSATESDLAQLALRHGLRPHLKLRTDPWASFGEVVSDTASLPAAELAWPVDEYSATEYWKALKSSGTRLDHRLCSLFENALLAANELLEAWSPSKGLGALSVHRSAIEPHPQDQFREVLDVLIDGLRDCGETLSVADPGLIERWWAFELPLFRRLAVHLLGFTQALNSSKKIQWLLGHDLIFDYHTKHETYAVLKAAIQGADSDVRADLLKRIGHGPELDYEAEQRHVEYMKYNVLVWITRADPSWMEAEAALAELQKANSEFSPRDHPDFDHWFESGTWGGAPPASLDEFKEMIRQDGADAALEWLLTKEYAEREFDEPTWDDALGLLRTLAESEPSSALELWASARLEGDGRAAEVRNALVQGWSRAELSELAPQIIGKAADLVSDPEAADAISVLLSEQVGKQADVLDISSLMRLREIARDLWENHNSAFEHAEDIDPTSLALNSWPGRVAKYWVKEISRRWRSDPEGWDGISESERDALLPLLHGSGAALDATRPALAGEVFFMFGADGEFTVENIFPLFSEAGLLRQSWEPYLYHPRWNNRFLERGFLELIVKARPHVNELSGRGLEGQYWSLLSSVLANSDIASEKRNSILDQLVIEEKERHIVNFIDSLADMLERQQADGVAKLWDAWIGPYLHRRFAGQPRRPLPGELEAWADLIPLLGEHIPSGVELVLTQAIGFRSRFQWDEVPAATIQKYATPLGQYLTHRLQSSSNLKDIAEYSIEQAVSAVAGSLDPEDRERLIRAAAEHGILVRQ